MFFQFSTMDTLLGKVWIFALDGWHFSIRVPKYGLLSITRIQERKALYMFKANYTSQAIKTMVENPQDRSGMISKACEAFGGNMIGMYMAFGDDDVIVIAEVPNDVSAAAISAPVSYTHLTLPTICSV